MPERLITLLGAPQWAWVLLVPFCSFVLTLGWLALILRRRGLRSFAVRGFGISMQIEADTGADRARRATDAEVQLSKEQTIE